MVKKYGDLFLDARRALLQNEDAEMAGMMARHLVCHVSGKSQEFMLAQRDQYASEEIVRAVEQGVRRLLRGEPLAYVLGEWEFYGLTLEVNSNVLIPGMTPAPWHPWRFSRAFFWIPIPGSWTCAAAAAALAWLLPAD